LSIIDDLVAKSMWAQEFWDIKVKED